MYFVIIFFIIIVYFLTFFFFAISLLLNWFYVTFIFMMMIVKYFSSIEDEKVCKCSNSTSVLFLLKKDMMRIKTFFLFDLDLKYIFSYEYIFSIQFTSALSFKMFFWFVFWSNQIIKVSRIRMWYNMIYLLIWLSTNFSI